MGPNRFASGPAGTRPAPRGLSDYTSPCTVFDGGLPLFNFKPGAVLLTLPAFALGTAFASATPLKGEVVATVPHVALTDLGRAPGNGYLNIALTLRYRNQATLDALDEAQTDPDSPVYLHWL